MWIYNKFQLAAPLGRYGEHLPQDIHNLKVALNHLGYYAPPAHVGIEEMREPALFDAIKDFQRDNGIKETDHLFPNTETTRAINDALINRDNAQGYIWRTAKDERVRDEHAAREGVFFV